MSAAAGRTVSKVSQAVKGAASKANTTANEAAGAGRKGTGGALNKGAKRDPELYVRLPSGLRSRSMMSS